MPRTNADRQRELPGLLKKWEQKVASIEEVRTMAADIGNVHFLPGIQLVIQLLDHEDDIVRYNAIHSIGFELKEKSVKEKLLKILVTDPDDDTRDAAAAALGTLFQSCKDNSVMRALGNSALNDTDDLVRLSSYKALFYVYGVSDEEHMRLVRDVSLKPDMNQIEQMLGKVPRKESPSQT